jgi:hypothetical protein
MGRPKFTTPSRVSAVGARRWVRALVAAVLALAAAAPSSASTLTTDNNTPFPTSTAIVGAQWTSPRYDPPLTQYGDIFPTTWADDDQVYAMINDGGLLAAPYRSRYPAKQWRHGLVRITGRPPNLRFRLVGRGDALGYLYSNGLTSVHGVLYATRVRPWDWSHFRPFKGLYGIAYSRDHGRHWSTPDRRFPDLAGNLNWVQEGRDQTNSDGFLYAIANEREFNASNIYLGRVRSGPSRVSDPKAWRWSNGLTSDGAGWRRSLSLAKPILTWRHGITYPRMSYDPGIGRYLLSFSYSYHNDSWARTYTGGAELVVLEAPHPWGPFSFVFREPYWGPSNGYGGSFPLKWQSADGRDLWMAWAANWFPAGGCLASLDCSGRYGHNLRALHLDVAGR